MKKALRGGRPIDGAGVYVLEGAKFSLQLLSATSNLIPVPWVGTAVNAAISAIQISQVSIVPTCFSMRKLKLILARQNIKQNRDDCDELATRICGLMLVIVVPLKDKYQSDIPPSLQADITQLTTYVKLSSYRHLLSDVHQAIYWPSEGSFKRLSSKTSSRQSSFLELMQLLFGVAVRRSTQHVGNSRYVSSIHIHVPYSFSIHRSHGKSRLPPKSPKP